MVQKTCVVVVSGERERLQMAAMVASVAAVSGHEVLVFLSMNALPLFMKANQALEAPSEGPMGNLMVSRRVPEYRSLFEQAVSLGEARIFPCSMAMDVLSIARPDLVEYLEEPTGLTKFLSDAQDSQVWTF